MRYSLEVKTAPLAEPVTRSEAKTHCRIESDITEDDDLIDGLIVAAREWVENYCRRSMVARTYRLRMDSFCDDIRLPCGPVISLTSITAGGSVVDSSIYESDLYSLPARVSPVWGQVWPSVNPALNAVVIEYVAGYSAGATSPTDHAANVPKSMKAAMKLLIGHLYENREESTERALSTIPLGIKHILAPFEIRDYNLE